MFGGRGPDDLSGNAGNDTLVGIGGGHDILRGETGFDSFWCDPTDVIYDADGWETFSGNTHRVASFRNGASTELLGQDIAEPIGAGATTNLSDRPLFSSAGPSRDDIHQGYIGNCGTMAVMGAIADENPTRIRQSIVDLGDGTYAAEFHAFGVARHVRIDGDLPTWTAGDGAQGSIWVRLLEKAFATDRGSYAATEARWMSDVMSDFGRSPSSIWWGAWSSGSQFLTLVKAQLDSGKAVTVSTNSAITSGARVIAGHAYHVIAVDLAAGTITLRNPWGFDGVGTDGNPLDGYVTVHASQVANNFVVIQSAYA